MHLEIMSHFVFSWLYISTCFFSSTIEPIRKNLKSDYFIPDGTFLISPQNAPFPAYLEYHQFSQSTAHEVDSCICLPIFCPVNLFFIDKNVASYR